MFANHKHFVESHSLCRCIWLDCSICPLGGKNVPPRNDLGLWWVHLEWLWLEGWHEVAMANMTSLGTISKHLKPQQQKNSLREYGEHGLQLDWWLFSYDYFHNWLKTLLDMQNWIRALQSNPTMTVTLMTVMITDGYPPRWGWLIDSSIGSMEGMPLKLLLRLLPWNF